MTENSLLIAVMSMLMLPCFSAVLAFAIPAPYRWLSPLLSSFILLITTFLSIIIILAQWDSAPLIWQSAWFQLGEITITAGIFLNNTTLILLFIISFISLMVHIFSTGYMAGDKGEQRYFGMLGFFTFAMVGLVLADNLLLLFICWELVGFSSFILIGHWREKSEAATAATNAFLINRVADLGFLAALLILWTNTGSFNLTSFVFTGTESWRTAASLCLLVGVMGKSAQIPFFNWLSGAMEGPTPVSALIHAATMVVAGVFLLIRVFPLFTPQALDVTVIVGCTTALLGAFAALHQFDLKKILAYSTISQLGFMVAAVGAGAYGIALLHLFTHAFFKAGLFLGAGSVIHSLHQAQHSGHVHFDVQDIRNLGGLKKVMPITFFCFIVCAAALAGLPLFSGFQSKDAILISLFDWSNASWRIVFAWMLVATVVLTIFYTVRMVWFVFLAAPNKTSLVQVEEVPAIMRFPVILLSVGSLWWMVSYHPLEFSGWLLPSIQPSYTHNILITWLSMMLIPVFALLAFIWYQKRRELPNISFLQQGFYLDTLQTSLVTLPIRQIAKFTMRVDARWIDGTLHAATYVQVSSAHFIAWVDRTLVDGLVDVIGRIAHLIGSIARSFTGGKIQTYIFWSLFTLIIFLFWVLF